MLVKSLLIVSFIGMSLACDTALFMSKCLPYTQKMGEFAQKAQASGGAPNIAQLNTMCCLVNLQVTCIKDTKCDQHPQFKDQLAPLQEQLDGLCSSYTYEEGCLEGADGAKPEGAKAESGGAEAEAESKDGDAGAHGIIPSILTLAATLTALFKIYH